MPVMKMQPMKMQPVIQAPQQQPIKTWSTWSSWSSGEQQLFILVRI